MPAQIQNLPGELQYALVNWKRYGAHAAEQAPDSMLRFIRELAGDFRKIASTLRGTNGRPLSPETWQVPSTMPPEWLEPNCTTVPNPQGRDPYLMALRDAQNEACPYWHYAQEAIGAGDSFGLGRALYQTRVGRKYDGTYEVIHCGLFLRLPEIAYFREGVGKPLPYLWTASKAPSDEKFPTWVAYWRAILVLDRLIETFNARQPRFAPWHRASWPAWRTHFDQAGDPRLVPPQPPIPFDEDRVFFQRLGQALRTLVFETGHIVQPTAAVAEAAVAQLTSEKPRSRKRSGNGSKTTRASRR